MQLHLSVHIDAPFSIFNEAIVGENALLVSQRSSMLGREQCVTRAWWGQCVITVGHHTCYSGAGQFYTETESNWPPLQSENDPWSDTFSWQMSCSNFNWPLRTEVHPRPKACLRPLTLKTHAIHTSAWAYTHDLSTHMQKNLETEITIQ